MNLAHQNPWREDEIKAIHLLHGHWTAHQGMGGRAGLVIAHAMAYLGNRDRYIRPKRGSSAVKTGKQRAQKVPKNLVANLWDVR